MTDTTYASPTERVKTWRDGAVLHIRFNNPAKHNALSVDMWEALPPLLARAEADDAVRLVVFSGEGTKSFVSGADISQFEDMRAAREAVKRYEVMAEDALMGIHDFGKPTIAAIRGYCIGGGVNVAISCDIRLASADSVFAIPATRLGLGYRFSALKNLVDLVGPGHAKDIFFTARRLPAQEARDIGLVNRVVPVEELDALVAEYATMISTGAPLTMKVGKRIMREVLKPDSGIDMELCRRLILDCFESEDYAEGRTAFMEKRKPVFRGK
ncbi:MAG: enoyl-CoA hydratase/isomerase family protein [Betaproteobacteria bacterium]|nr:enoyl-CoA hydratase/isomerase family protein [Betaproteobacteria bacterium]